MECYCEPAFDDGDFCQVWNVEHRKARKQYRCCECHEPIAIGDKYEYIFAVYDGEVSTFRTCEFCSDEYQELIAKYPDVSWRKGNDDLACLLVWDLRNEAAGAEEER